MSKRFEKIKTQLADPANVVNIFNCEAVQVRVAETLLEVMDWEMRENRSTDQFTNGNGKGQPSGGLTRPKKPGATKTLNKVLLTDFFDTPRTITEIVDRCNEEHDSDIKASDVSGILMKLVKENRLSRERGDGARSFTYSRSMQII